MHKFKKQIKNSYNKLINAKGRVITKARSLKVPEAPLIFREGQIYLPVDCGNGYAYLTPTDCRVVVELTCEA